MAKVIMFTGEAKRNAEFKKVVEQFVSYILEGDITIETYSVNTQSGRKCAFEENPDCEIVFTTENDTENQEEACSREILVFEWRCFTSKKLVPVKIVPMNEEGSMLARNHYGIRTSH